MAVKKQTFMNGVLVVMFSQILIKIFGFVYRIILTNIPSFSDEGNSYYGSAYQVYTLILAIATMGIPNTISKLVSEKMAIDDKRGAHRIFQTAMGLFVFIATIFSASLFLGAGAISTNILKNPGVKYSLMALAPAIIFVSMSATLRGYFLGMQNMMQYSKTQVIEQIVNSIFSVVFVVMLTGSSPEIMAAGSTLATTLSASVAFLYMLKYYNKNKKDIWEDVKKSTKYALESKKQIVKKLISYVLPISFASVVAALSGVIDIVTVMDGLQKFGYDLQTANEKFGILLGKVDILTNVPLALNVAFSVALVPFVSSALAKGRKDEAVSKINYSLKTSTMIALPCTAGLFILAKPIFELLFPNATAGAYLLQIQCWMVIFSVLDQTLSGSLQGFGKLYVPGAGLLVGAVTKYILNVVFIPIYGEIVPAITTVVYNVIAFAISYIALFRILKQKHNFKNIFLKPILATGIMSISTLLFYKLLAYFNISNSIDTVLSIIFAIVIYVLSVIYIGILNEDEIKQLPGGNKIWKVCTKLKKI